jgi:hypothetical protein
MLHANRRTQFRAVGRAGLRFALPIAVLFTLSASAQTPGEIVPIAVVPTLTVAFPAPTPTLLRGYIAVSPTIKVDQPIAVLGAHARDIFLPNVEVYARNLLNNQITGPAITDLSGRFTLPVSGPARYAICWKAPGLGDGCSRALVSVANRMVNVGTVRIDPPRNADSVAVFGKVTFKNGGRTRFFEPLANINAFARVLLMEGSTRLDEVFVNNFGEYFLPRVPVNAEIVLRAVIDKGVGEQRILHRLAGPNALAKAPFHSIDLVVENTPPRLDPLVPLDGAGRRVKVAKPGSKIALEAHASDPDGDPIRYTWLPSDGSGTLSALAGPKVVWTLPDAPGLYSVTVFADDGKGGYVASSVSLRADELGIPFSGRVVDTAGTAVPGAIVDINGQLAVTGAQGTFATRVRDASLFVMNIRKAGFGLNSHIYDNGLTGGRWILARASVTTVDPTRSIKFTQERGPRDCPGPESSHLNYKDYPKLAVPQYQDGKGNVVRPFGDLKLSVLTPPDSKREAQAATTGCGLGISVEIPANALVDEAGRAPSGAVQLALSTVDLMSTQQMPGDYTATETAGGIKVMQSYGAGSIEVSAGGRRYNLKPGAKARVVIPVDRSQLAAGAVLPPTIPLLFYDERSGIWRQEGDAKLVGAAYEAEVGHFSYINADTLKTDQACVRVLSPTLPTNYNLEVWIPQPGGAAPKVFNKPFDNSPPSEHVIFNLPLNTNIVLIPERQNDNTPIGTFIVNTGQAQNPTTPNHPAGPPYTACSTQVTLTEQALPEEPLSGEFLQGLFSFEATNLNELDPADPAQDTLKNALDQATKNYYGQVDPPLPSSASGRRATFGGFKSVNGFGGAGEIRVVYANSGDLGFGRDMHCVSKTASDGLADYACYVTNYGNILTPDLQDAADAQSNNNPVATVAMEYSRIEDPGIEPPQFSNPTRVVKFFVYNGNVDASTFVNAADLDTGQNLRKRPVPQLCMVCHGGEYPNPPVGPPPAPGHLPVPGFNSPADVNLGARFLPFDLHYYTFAGGAPDKLAQQPAFKNLNQQIVANAPPDPIIGEVITNMYAGGPNEDENFVVNGWKNAPSQPLKEQVYRDVVARTCRTCHIANHDPNLTFSQAQQMIDRLGSVEQRVCVQHVMPHSKVTHKIFWGVPLTPPPSPEQSKVAALQVFGDTFANAVNGWQGNLCGIPISGGTTPQTFYQSNVQPIFSNNSQCTSCHIGGSPPANLNLDPTHSYSQLVNIPAVELNTMSRVTPNNTAQSYMFHKVEGDQANVGGSGQQMPAGGPPLQPAEINTIQTWINTGAAP